MVEYPRELNDYILNTNGTHLDLRCESRPEHSAALTPSVYKLSLQHPCTLNGQTWNLHSTFHRAWPATLQPTDIIVRPYDAARRTPHVHEAGQIDHFWQDDPVHTFHTRRGRPPASATFPD